MIHLDIEPVTESYVEIVDVKSGHRVVTAIEVLSPTNKRPAEGQRLYLKKRDDLKLAGVNTVEIDLLRGGERVLMVPRSWSRLHIALPIRCASGGRRSLIRCAVVPGSAPRAAAGDLDPVASRGSGRAAGHFRRFSTSATATGATTISTIAASPTRRCRPMTRSWADALLREQGRRWTWR